MGHNILKCVDQLTSAHIGKIIRVQGYNGGYIEGTLARIDHHASEPFGSHIQSFVSFEEFANPVKDGTEYISFQTHGNREAAEVDE